MASHWLKLIASPPRWQDDTRADWSRMGWMWTQFLLLILAMTDSVVEGGDAVVAACCRAVAAKKINKYLFGRANRRLFCVFESIFIVGYTTLIGPQQAKLVVHIIWSANS